MGIKTPSSVLVDGVVNTSEKPPHHMGIKTAASIQSLDFLFSEKPPHHMGIKTTSQ